MLAFNMMDPTIVKIFEKRGIPPENIECFFSKNLREELTNLENLQDLEKASKRVIAALDNGEKNRNLWGLRRGRHHQLCPSSPLFQVARVSGRIDTTGSFQGGLRSPPQFHRFGGKKEYPSFDNS